MDSNKNNVPAPGSEEKKFTGYTLADLRYQRALIALKKEFSKSKTLSSASKVKKRNPFTGDGKSFSLPGRVGGIASRLIGGLNYVDYAMLGFSLFNSGRKIFSFFRRHRK